MQLILVVNNLFIFAANKRFENLQVSVMLMICDFIRLVF